MIIDQLLLGTNRLGYIAGSADGIVTVKGRPDRRDVYLLNAENLAIEQVGSSLENGHYIFMGLELDKQYLLMVRDFKPNGIEQRYEPFAWDHLTPSDDLTPTDQQALWQSWQTN